MTHQTFYVRLQLDHPTNGSMMRMKAIVINAMSYDVFIVGTTLSLMGFTLDFSKEVVSYKLK
jgi:hypothetical protein